MYKRQVQVIQRAGPHDGMKYASEMGEAHMAYFSQVFHGKLCAVIILYIICLLYTSYNIGLFDICSQPYPEMMEAVKACGADLYEVAAGEKMPAEEKAERTAMIAF